MGRKKRREIANPNKNKLLWTKTYNGNWELMTKRDKRLAHENEALKKRP